MKTVIARSVARRVGFLLVLAFGCPPLANAGIPERLKWVRGTIAMVSPGGMTVALRSRTIECVFDNTTEVMLVSSGTVTRRAEPQPATAYLRTGDSIEVHYRDNGRTHVARYVWLGIPLNAGSISKRPGTSAAGTVTQMKPGHWLLSPRMTLTSGKDHRGFLIASNAQLMDARGRVDRARTMLPPAANAIQLNDRAIVVYRENRSTLTAHVIRMLPVRP